MTASGTVCYFLEAKELRFEVLPNSFPAHHWNLKVRHIGRDTAWKMRGFNLRNEINQLKRNSIGTNTSIFLGFKMFIFQGVSLRFTGSVSP